MSKKEKRTTPVDLPKEYRVVIMHFAKHKSYRVYCKNMALKGRRDHHSAARPHLLTFTKSGICILAGSRYRITYFGKGKIPLCLRRTGAILFRKIIPFYLPEDLERGYIKAENKHGETKRYPIIELASERIY